MSTPLPASPYKGLAPFGDSELDAQLFFGRERDSEIVVANLLAARLTVLYGASGVGKSSLLRASVARRLREEPDAEVIVFSSWLGDAVAPLRAAQQAAAAGREAYLILDQFEEYFLYHADDAGEGTLPDELPALLGRTDHRVNVLISVREDALALLDAFKAQIPNVLANYLRLPHLDRAAGRAAIVGPLERWSELAGADEAVEIEPALVEAVLDGTGAGRLELGGGAASPGQIEAPILQLVMERLWDAERQQGSRVLHLETFTGLGGAAAIVRDHLERALAALGPAEQDAAAAMFDHLVTPSGSKIALRASDLADYAGVTPAELAPVLATLGRERILRSVEGGAGDGAERYEIFHDVLGDAVLAWRAELRLDREREASARRHRRLVGVAGVAIAALAVVTAVAVFAVVERDRAQSHERQATANELEASALLGLPDGKDNSLALALRAARLDPGDRSEDILRKVLVGSRLRTSLPAPGPVRTLAFSGDGKRLLVAGGGPRLLLYDPDTGRLARSFRDSASVTAAALGPVGLLLSGDENGQVRLRNAATGAVLRSLGGHGPVTSVSFGDRGRLLLVTTGGAGAALVARTRGGRVRAFPQPGPVVRGVFDPAGDLVATIAVGATGQARARVFDVVSGRLLYVLPQLGVQDVEFSPDGALLATASHDGTIGLWSARSGRPVRLLDDGVPTVNEDVNDVAFSPDGKLLAAAGGDGATRVWTVATGARLYFFPEHDGGVVAVEWSPDGGVLGDASRDRAARLYVMQGVVAGSLIAILPGNAGGASALAFDPTGARLATGGFDGDVRLWDASSEERLVELGSHPGGAFAAAYSPDGSLIVSTGEDGTARIWDAGNRRLLHVLRLHSPGVDASFSPDGELVVTAGKDGAVQLWRVSDGALLRTLGHEAPLTRARFSQDGSLVAAASGDGTVGLWRVSDGRRLHLLRVGGPVSDVAFAPDGRTVAIASSGGASIWSVSDGPRLHALPVGGKVLRLAYSPDGTLLATGDDRGTARLWDVESGRLRHVLRRHRSGSKVTDVVFSSDGKLLLTTGADSDGHVWAVPGGEHVALLRGHFGALRAGAFSPDGRWAATAGGQSAGLWQTPSGRRFAFLRGHEQQLTAVSFSPDGRDVLTASEDGTVRLYRCTVCGDLASLEALAAARLARSGVGT